MDKKILTRVFVIAALFVGLTVNSAFAYRAEATIDNQCGDDIVAVYVYGSGADSSLRDVIPAYSSLTIVFFPTSGDYVHLQAVFRNGYVTNSGDFYVGDGRVYWTIKP